MHPANAPGAAALSAFDADPWARIMAAASAEGFTPGSVC